MDGHGYGDYSGGMTDIVLPVEAGATYEIKSKTTRGTSNKNERGGSEDRRKRREWLVMTYRADVDLLEITVSAIRRYLGVPHGQGAPACRCYRCGTLLTVETVTADRIIPGCQGGTYRRNNIRPACGTCNSITGGSTRRKGR